MVFSRVLVFERNFQAFCGFSYGPTTSLRFLNGFSMFSLFSFCFKYVLGFLNGLSTSAHWDQTTYLILLTFFGVESKSSGSLLAYFGIYCFNILKLGRFREPLQLGSFVRK